MKIETVIQSKHILTPSGFVDGYVLINENKIVDVVEATSIGDDSPLLWRGVRGEA